MGIRKKLTEKWQEALQAVLPAARSFYAKGTGTEQAERFLGVSIAAEKEMIFMVTKREGKMRSCGPSWTKPD